MLHECTLKFRVPHECRIFAVIKILTRPVTLLPTVGQTLHMSQTVLIWPSRPQSSHIGSTMDLAANTRAVAVVIHVFPQVNDAWELGSFASGGVPDKPPGFQLVLWDTNPRLNGLVAADLDAVVSRIIPDFPANVGYADGLFVMTTATDRKNNLNRSGLKKNNPRSLRVETIANSAGGTAQVALVAQPGIGFLNGRFHSDGSPTEDTEDCLGRITVGLTRSKSLTVLVSPLDMLGLMGMAQVLAAVAYGIVSNTLTLVVKHS